MLKYILRYAKSGWMKRLAKQNAFPINLEIKVLLVVKVFITSIDRSGPESAPLMRLLGFKKN